MAFNEIAQIKQLLAEKKNFLIAFRANGGDSTSAALALALFLKKMGKMVDIVSPDYHLPKNLSFLKDSQEIKPEFPHLKKFVVSIDINKTGVEELSYDIKQEKLRIFITPKKGFLTRDDISTAQSEFKYEAIFILDTPDLTSLGQLFDNNTELFYKQPIINIDHSLANEQFGEINIIDSSVSSVSEVVYQIINELGGEHLTEEIATAILTGMIINTKSFKDPATKPQTLTLASKLISLGAKRDNIVQNLYRTKSIATLKLWGIALSHLQHQNNLGLVYTSLTREDFARSGAEDSDLRDMVDELISNSPEAKMILILFENYYNQNNVNGIFYCDKNYNALEMLAPYTPTGSKQKVSFLINNKKMAELEQEIIEQIKKTVL